MDGGHLKTLRDRGMSLGSGNFGPTIDFAGFGRDGIFCWVSPIESRDGMPLKMPCGFWGGME
jgi:hypothetical protein